MPKPEHLQVGSIHIYFYPCAQGSNCEHRVEIKAPGYKHTIEHAEGTLFEAKAYSIETACKLSLISHEEASEALASLL